MITITLERKGKDLGQVAKQLPSIPPKVIRQGLYEVGREMYQETRRLIKEGPKSGKMYRVRGRNHQASAIGQAPANLTGKLRRSVGFQVHGSEEVEYGYGQDYGAYLEDGTGRMGARPALRLAFKNKENRITQVFESKFKELMEYANK